MNWPAFFIVISALSFAGCDQNPSNQSTGSNSSPPNTAAGPATAPDNSGVNTRDRGGDAVTADSQGQKKPDVTITADIRKRIMDAKMSVNAENVKVITTDGRVTLRGPVNDQNEKDQIGKIAADVAGEGNVDNQLEPKTNPTTNPSGM